MVAPTAMAASPPLAVGNSSACATVSVTASTPAGPANLPSNPQGSVGSLPAHPQGTAANSTSDVGPTRTRTSENRRSNKPIMEKRRRARINSCLNELKRLILEAMKKDPTRHSKLEKADILEMTVKHLENLQRHQTASDPNVVNKYRAGFSECAGEVRKFPGLDEPVKRRLLQHLSNCLNNSSPSLQPSPTPQTTEQPPPTTTQPVQVHILRTPDSNVIQGLHLVQTRLPNGDIALILPAARAPPVSSSRSSPSPSSSSSSSGSSPIPTLIPIPNRNIAASPSPVAFDRLSVNPAPPHKLTVVATQAVTSVPIPMQVASPELEQRRLVNEEYIDNRPHYGDQETLLHIPDNEYYEDSYEDSESDYYPSQCHSPDPVPLSLVTRKRCEEPEEQPWRPW